MMTKCFLLATIVATVNAAGPGGVLLGRANGFAVLGKSGISTVPQSDILGDIGVSPIAAAAITGFTLTADSSNNFATSTQVTGKVFAADYAVPTPSDMTATISDMETAYTDAAGRTTPDFIDLGAGEIGGLTLEAGLYKYGTSIDISSDITISGSSTDTWIFQAAGNLKLGTDVNVYLEGGALASNIVWQVAGTVEVADRAHLEGIVLVKTAANFYTGSSINGRVLSQTAVVLQQAKVVQPEGDLQVCTMNSNCAFGRTCVCGSRRLRRLLFGPAVAGFDETSGSSSSDVTTSSEDCVCAGGY